MCVLINGILKKNVINPIVCYGFYHSHTHKQFFSSKMETMYRSNSSLQSETIPLFQDMLIALSTMQKVIPVSLVVPRTVVQNLLSVEMMLSDPPEILPGEK